MKILLVDDSRVIRQLYSDFLGIRNHSVESVNNGKEGLELVIKNDYDFILLDMCMPKYSGMDFLRDLKKQRPSELKKVMVVSQLDFNENDYEELLNFGINSIQKKTLNLVKIEDPMELEVKHNLV